MQILAYSYCEPIGEGLPDRSLWGWEVNRIYLDFGPDRPQLQTLIQDCQRQGADYLLLRRLEELGESLGEVSDRLHQIESLKVCVLTTEQDYRSTLANQDLSSKVSNSEALLSQQRQLLELLNAVQSEQRRRQIRRGHARNRLKTLPPPGKPPYGYRRGKERYVIDRPAAAVIKDFFEYFLLYGSLRGAVRHLQQKHGKQISVSTGRRWLTNPVYRGDLLYQNQQVVRGTHAAILSREEAAQVDRLLRRNRHLAPRSVSAPRSLAGLVSCGECQSPMNISRVTAPRRDQEYLYLRPIACPHRPKCPALVYEKVLQQTIEQICQTLPQAIAGVDLPGLVQRQQQVAGEIMKREQAIAQLPKLVTEGILDAETAALRTYNLRTEIAQLQDQLAQLPPPNLKQIAQTLSIPQFWLDLSESERRIYLREFIRQIQIQYPTPGEWRVNILFVF